MAEKRKRGQNYNSDEKDRLIKLVIDHKDTILNKKTDGTTNEAKSHAWVALTDSFNTTGTIYRSKDSLMKMWEKLKSDSKVYYTASRRDATQTGGGPSVIKIDPILEQVCAVLGRGCTGIIGVPDSDCVEEFTVSDSLAKVICIDNENLPTPDTHTQLKHNFELQEAESNKNIEIEGKNVRKTPLWSRRQPRLFQPNERSEAVSTMYNSFKEINIKKENIEDLKQQLLQEEIEFKRKLYNLQLRSATIEVEIKNEVLCQVKGGVLPLQNLFGVQKKTEQIFL